MPRQPHIPPSLMNRPFRGSVAIGAGLITRSQLRSGVWTQLYRDVYVHSACQVDLSVRAFAAGLLIPPSGAISGFAALALQQRDWCGEDRPVEVSVPSAQTFR